MNDFQRSIDALLSQFYQLHTDINGISALMIESKNTNRGEAIVFGVSGRQILGQGVANFQYGIVDEKW